MIVRLFCPICAYEVAQKREPSASVDVPLPVSRITDDGRYDVRCRAGHDATVVLNNLKFELLFEMGLNAILDGYPREAVSSFASSLESFYEFYWRITMNQFDVPASESDLAWKALAKQSERQLGAFVSAYLDMMKSSPKLLNPNNEVKLRNRVIHQGYVPTGRESVAFGDSVMDVINTALEGLRRVASESMMSTYKQMSPAPDTKEDDTTSTDEVVGAINILTAIDVRHPPTGDDRRVGSVEAQFPRIIHERQLFGMEILNPEEFKKRFPDNPLESEDSE